MRYAVVRCGPPAFEFSRGNAFTGEDDCFSRLVRLGRLPESYFLVVQAAHLGMGWDCPA